jgi:hypothetical protein
MQEAERQSTGSQLAMPTPEPYRLDESGFSAGEGRLGLSGGDDGTIKGEEALLDDEVTAVGASEGEPRKVWQGRRTLRRYNFFRIS